MKLLEDSVKLESSQTRSKSVQNPVLPSVNYIVLTGSRLINLPYLTKTIFTKKEEKWYIWVAQWCDGYGVGLVIERSWVRLQAGALPGSLGQLSLPSLRG